MEGFGGMKRRVLLGFRFRKEIRCVEGFLVRVWKKTEAKVGSFREKKTRIEAICHSLDEIVQLLGGMVSHNTHNGIGTDKMSTF